MVLAFVLLIIGATLRYYYYFLAQYGLKLVIAISIAILASSVLMTLLRTRPHTYKDSLAFAMVVAILCSFSYESAAANKLKNEKYLSRLAGIVIRYSERNHRPPSSVDEAVEAGDMLPNRGDADGNSYQYLHLTERAFVIQSLGRNQRSDRGAEDDVRLSYVNGNLVSFEELSNWVQQSGTEEEKDRFAAYWPASNKSR